MGVRPRTDYTKELVEKIFEERMRDEVPIKHLLIKYRINSTAFYSAIKRLGLKRPPKANKYTGNPKYTQEQLRKAHKAILNRKEGVSQEKILKRHRISQRAYYKWRRERG